MFCLVVAFPAEARPLIEYYELKLIASEPFPIYQNDQLFLILSGMGKLRAACATTFLYSFTSSVPDSVWLNVGIAGHNDHEIGTPFLAQKVVDRASDKMWYPSFVIEVPCKTESILTVDKCETDYEQNCLYDMEASGFFEAAFLFSSSEFVHCFKVVSDNGTRPAKKITPDFVEKLIEKNMKTLRMIVKNLVDLQKKLPKTEAPLLNTLLKRIRFTVTEQHQLKKRLTRLKTLGIKDAVLEKELERLSSSKEVFKTLERKSASLPVEV